MPIFEFECLDCEKQVEILVRNQELPVCPVCQGKKLEKLMSVAAVSGKEAGLPMAGGCPPVSHGPCGPGCCRIP